MAASWQIGAPVATEAQPMRASTSTITFETVRAPEFVDITDSVCDIIRQSGIQIGIAMVFSRHTTGAIKINESEPLLIKDMEEFLDRVAPRNGDYRHNDFSVRTVNMTEDECPNGHAHCQHLLLSTSESVPIIGGEPQFGQYQRVFFIELDRPRSREVMVQLLGA